MKKTSILNNLNWKILLIRLLVNAIAIILVAILMPNIYFVQFSLINVLIIGLVLGLLNAFLKPVLMFLTAQFFFATFGLMVILINTLFLYLIARWFPQILVVHGLIWAFIGGAVLGLVSNTLENLLGVYPPIVPEDDLALRKQIEEKSASPMQNLIGDNTKRLSSSVDTQSLGDVQAAQAALDVLNNQALDETVAGKKQPAPVTPETTPEAKPKSQPSSGQDGEEDTGNETTPPGRLDNDAGAS